MGRIAISSPNGAQSLAQGIALWKKDELLFPAPTGRNH